MSVRYLNNRSFLKRVILAVEGMNTLEFEPLDAAFTRLLENLAYNLNDLILIFPQEKQATANLIDLKEKVLEKNNKKYLDALTEYVLGVESLFQRASVEYGKLCLNCLEVKSKKNKDEIYKAFLAVLEQEKSFKTAIEKVKKFAARHLLEIHQKHLTELPNYASLFSKMDRLSKLTWDEVKHCLTSEKSIL